MPASTHPVSIPTDHPSLPGHFPGHPVVPGVVVLEQVLDAIAAHDAPLAAPMRWPQVKFVAPLLPGQAADVELERVGQARHWRWRVLHAGRVLASGEVAGA